LSNLPIEDPVNRQMAALLQVMLFGLIAIGVIAMVINLIVSSELYSWQELVRQGLLVSIIFGVPLILLRRGHFYISVNFIIALILILVTFAILNTNLRNIAEILTFFTLTTLLAGLLIGRRALIITFVASTGIVLFVTLRERDPTLRLDYITIAGNFILLNGLMSVFIDSFGMTLRNELAERTRVEQEREELIRELEERNIELTRFNYTVSHELKTPIVTIKGFLGSIERDLEAGNYERAQGDFRRIANATDKMQRTLFDLLELSRIGRINIPLEEISLSELAQKALDTIQKQIQAKAPNTIVHITPDLPVVYGDRARLREVFENLITNAANYMGEQTSPCIEIGMRQGAEPVFFVKDNGIGIEPEYHEKIFGLFERLDPTSEGTGIGLALVKRIIEMHGGEIWVESEGTGKGSTFCFTIPERGVSK
jgi:signal transduction histidine kinase